MLDDFPYLLYGKMDGMICYVLVPFNLHFAVIHQVPSFFGSFCLRNMWL